MGILGIVGHSVVVAQEMLHDKCTYCTVDDSYRVLQILIVLILKSKLEESVESQCENG
jgi:hypothetical protein